jgi:hypothetical protein
MPDVKGCRRAPFPARGGGIPVRLGPLQEVDQRAAAHWHHGGGGFVEVPAGRLGRPNDAARGIPDSGSDLVSLAQTGCLLEFAPSIYPKPHHREPFDFARGKLREKYFLK